MITPTGAGGVLVLDACQGHGFLLDSFSEDHMAQMQELFLPWQRVTNPLDIMSAALAHGYKKVYTRAVETLMKDMKVDAIFCVLGEPTLKTVTEVAKRFPAKPIISWVIGQPTDLTQGITSIASYPSPERGLRCLAAMMEHQGFIMRKHTEKVPFPVDRKSVERTLDKAKKHNQKILTAEAFSILNAYGIPVARFKIAKSKGQALNAAKLLQYPVVLIAVQDNLKI